MLLLGKDSVTEKKILDTYIQDKNILKAELNRRVNKVPVVEILVVWSKKREYAAFVVGKPEKTWCLLLFCVYLKIENHEN